MRSLQKKILMSTTVSMTLCLFNFPIYAQDVTYKNVFMSYYSPADVSAMVDYSKKQRLGGLILWEIKGDASYQSPHSLLAAANKQYGDIKNNPPQIMGYWTNWSVYTAQAIPQVSYPIPGSRNASGVVVTNKDFSDKLAGMNVVAYAFLEAQAKMYTYYDSKLKRNITKNNPYYSAKGGTLYFFDPWSDLLALGKDSFCQSSDNLVCWYVDKMQGKDPKAAAMMGNLEAFSQLKHANSANPLGKLQRVISVGGYAHDDTFEDTFDSAVHINNFVNSASEIINHYKLDGIDLDYENPAMTFQQSNNFYNLVKALRNKLGAKKIIMVTILANPAYMTGKIGNGVGFDPNARALQKISTLVNRINLMTYDFHGAFDYSQGKGRTGFLTNLYMPNDAVGFDPKFSVDTSVQAITVKLGIAPSKVAIGIPAYSRGLSGITSNYGGLFQIIPNSAAIPRGNLDQPACAMNIAPLSAASCSGSFTYRYIIKNMLGRGFTATTRYDNHLNVANGTTAYALNWTVPKKSGYKLEVSNTGVSGDLGVIVAIHDNNSHQLNSGYIGPSASVVFGASTTPSTSPISDLKNLLVRWSTYPGGPTGDCPLPLNFTTNVHVMVKVSNQGKGFCDYKMTKSIRSQL